MIIKQTAIGTVLITSDPDPETGQADEMVEIYPDELRDVISALSQYATDDTDPVTGQPR